MSLHDELKNEGYSNLTEKPGKGLCGLFRFIYTVGLVYGINEFGYEGRYCYQDYNDALSSLHIWNGIDDPPGRWIKHKARGIDTPNPNYGK